MARDPMPEPPNSSNYGSLIKIYDFSKGLCTVKPKVLLELGFSPEATNVWYDEEYALTKMPGTSSLLTAANSAYFINPIYNCWTWITPSGEEYLIANGKQTSDNDIVLAYLNKGSTTWTNIETGLTANRPCIATTYKGRMYWTNGYDALRYWGGNDEDVKILHSSNDERFKCIATHQTRLFLANSRLNPKRIIWSNPGECHFDVYYSNTLNWLDVPVDDNSEIQYITSWMDGLLIILTHSIHYLVGDLLALTSDEILRCIANGTGTWNGRTVQKHGDSVIFADEDGLWVLTQKNLYVSQEDMQVKSKSPAIMVTSEIENWWKENITVPTAQSDIVEQVKSGTDLQSFTMTTNANYRTDSVNTENPTVINATLSGASAAVITNANAPDAYISMNNVYSGQASTSIYYGQQFNFSMSDTSIPEKVSLYLDGVGTLTSAMKLNVYICPCDIKRNPDFTKCYATGQIALNTVSISSPGNYTVTFTYRDYPQSMYYGDSTSPSLMLVCKLTGVSATNYVKWGYNNTSKISNSRMANYDIADVGGHDQADCDYVFTLYGETFYHYSVVESTSFVVDDRYFYTFDRWGTVEVITDSSVIDSSIYTRKSKLKKLEVAESNDGSSWGSYSEIKNGGDVGATSYYVKFRMTFECRPDYYYDDDSFTLLKIRTNYHTKSHGDTIADSVIYDNRYWLTAQKLNYGLRFIKSA